MDRGIPDFWRWRFFSEKELRAVSTGGIRIVPAFLDRLDKLREAFGAPLTPTSFYRDPQHNARVSTTGDSGPHTTGRAIDLRIMGRDVYRLVPLAINLGFTGIGLSQKGDHRSRFIHLDDLPDGPSCPRPWIWTY